ncbi:MAG TPA: 2OG-Fe(II) oxygenase [Steroidobacteraceae bacterium]|nr:2OG-Fe(II) oxygenase [Steroidobacteraceae bacterium]
MKTSAEGARAPSCEPDRSESLAARIAAVDWHRIQMELDARGCAVLQGLLTARECRALIGCYREDHLFRSTIDMARHGFGRGEYRYFDYPLPPTVASLRAHLYAHLAPIANGWNRSLRIATRYPDTHEAYLARCHRDGQTRVTPLLLRYTEGDYNCLHQDLYGEHVFPMQVTFLLSEPAEDFTGGQFVLTEQRPRMQSRAEVVELALGDGVLFPVHHRPVASKRGGCRANLRHGVSRLRSGERYTAGIIFHDAR